MEIELFKTYVATRSLEILITTLIIFFVWMLFGRLAYVMVQDMYEDGIRLPESFNQDRKEYYGSGPLAFVIVLFSGLGILLGRPIRLIISFVHEIQKQMVILQKEEQKRKGWDE